MSRAAFSVFAFGLLEYVRPVDTERTVNQVPHCAVCEPRLNEENAGTPEPPEP